MYKLGATSQDMLANSCLFSTKCFNISMNSEPRSVLHAYSSMSSSCLGLYQPSSSHHTKYLIMKIKAQLSGWAAVVQNSHKVDTQKGH